MKSSSLRPGSRLAVGLLLSAVATAFTSGCFNSPDKSNISCTKNAYCPHGLVCVGASDSKPGVCAKATDDGSVDKGGPWDSGSELGPSIDSAAVDLALDRQVLDSQIEPIADVPLTTGTDSEIDSAGPLDVAASTGGTTGTGGGGVTGSDGATASGGDTGTVYVSTGGASGTGGTSGTGGASGTGGITTVKCTSSSQCNDGNPCTDDTCDATGNCRNTANDANSCTDASGCLTATHCVGGVCSGTAVTDGTHCGAHSCVGLSWNTETCVGGKCVGSALDANCDDSNLCTNDTCNNTSGCSHSTVTCTAPDLCHTASCSPSGGCTYTVKTCAPDACHTTATCNLSTGACEQGSTVACSPDACHTTAYCSLPGGCQQGQAVADGTLCQSGAYCSGSVRKKQSCTGGVCTDAIIGDCTTKNNACQSWTCQLGTGTTSCVTASIQANAPCPAPDVCWQSGICASNGTCVGQNPTADGTPCPPGPNSYGVCMGVGSLDWYEYQCHSGYCNFNTLTRTCSVACADNVLGGCTN